MKLKEPKYFVVLKKEYRPRLTIFKADWETDLSFGERGETFDCVRYTKSTGIMYSKKSCSWKRFDTEDEAIVFYGGLLKFQTEIDELYKLESDKTMEIHSHFNV